MKLTIPDYISLLRIPLTILFFVFINDAKTSFILLVLVMMSDVADGWIARKYNWVSKHGGALDPITDKIFIVGVFIAYTIIGKLLWWEFMILVLRDVYSAIEMIYIVVTKDVKTHKANIWGKLTTTLQFFMIAVLIFEFEIANLPLIMLILFSGLYTAYTYAKPRWFK